MIQYIPQLPKSIKKIGVFVDEEIETVVDFEKIKLTIYRQFNFMAKNHLSIVIKNYNTRFYRAQSMKLIKVFSIKDEFNFEVLKPYENVCDYFLFDTKGKLPGGNGYTFNWNVLNNYPSTKPFFLSGGIGLEEIDKLKEFIQSPASKFCYAIDVNSKFEIEPGLKNIELLQKFKQISCLRRNDREYELQRKRKRLLRRIWRCIYSRNALSKCRRITPELFKNNGRTRL